MNAYMIFYVDILNYETFYLSPITLHCLALQNLPPRCNLIISPYHWFAFIAAWGIESRDFDAYDASVLTETTENRAVRKTFPRFKKYGWHFYLQMACREFSKIVICCRKIPTGTTLVDISRFRHLCDRVGDNRGISDYASSFLFTFTPHITLMCMYEYNVG